MMNEHHPMLHHVVPDVTITSQTPVKNKYNLGVTSEFESSKFKVDMSDVEDDDDAVFCAQSTLVLGERPYDDDVMHRPLKPAIPLERIPSWRPEEEAATARQNTFVLKSGHALNGKEPSPYNVPITTVYNPSGTTGCFFNRHTLAHMLGLCRISSRFGKKCTHRKLSKKKRFELDYGFLSQRNHIKIYDFNRRLRHAVASGNNTSHRERVLQILAKEAHCRKETKDVTARPSGRNDVTIKGAFPEWVEDEDERAQCDDVSDEDMLRRRAFSFDASTSLRRGRARASQRAAASRHANNSHAQSPEVTSPKQSTSAFKRLARSFRLSKGERKSKTHKHKVLSGSSRLGKPLQWPHILTPTPSSDELR